MRSGIRRLVTVVACLGMVVGTAVAQQKAKPKKKQAVKREVKQPGPVESSEYYTQLAELNLRFQNVDKALANVGQALDVAKTNKEKAFATMLKAKCLQLSGKRDEATMATQEAVKLLEAAVKENPKDKRLAMMLEKMKEAGPDESAYYANLGEINLRFRHYDEALEAANKAIEKAADNKQKAMCMEMKGRCLRAKGQKEEALKAFQDALALDKSSRVVSSAATALAENGKADEAMALVEARMKQNPKDKGLERLYLNLASNQARKLVGEGKVDEGLKMMKDLAAKNPKDKWMQSNYDSLVNMAAQKKAGEGKTDAAIALLQDALTKNPNDPGLTRGLVQVYLRAKRNEDAMALVKKQIGAAKGAPEKIEALFTAADIARRTNELDDSAKFLNQIKELPDTRGSHKRVDGMLQQIEKQKERAAKQKEAPKKAKKAKKEEAK